MESIDILPTIFDVLNVDPRVKMDGKSALGEEARQRRRVRILERNSFKPLLFPAAGWERRADAQLERKLAIFGDGADGPLRLFRIGPDQELLFKPLSDYRVTNGSGASFVGAGEYRNVDLKSPTIPVHVTGHLKGIPTGRDRHSRERQDPGHDRELPHGGLERRDLRGDGARVVLPPGPQPGRGAGDPARRHLRRLGSV